MADAKQQGIQKQQQRKPDAMQILAGLIASRRDAFALVAGKGFNPDRLVKLAQGALARTPKLAECHSGSVLVALMRCAELDLEPDAALPQRRMWLVPRWNSKLSCQECTYIIDYRAQLQKARETGLVTSIVAETVYEKDTFAYELTPEGSSIVKFQFRPDPFADDRGKVKGYFAAARLEGGEVQFIGMSRKQMEKHRDLHAPKKKGGELAGSPWTAGEESFNAMGCKTVLRRLFNLLPAGKSEAARALQEQLNREAEIEEAAKPVVGTAPVELDLGAPPSDAGGTADEVAAALTGGDEKKGDEKATAREPGEEG